MKIRLSVIAASLAVACLAGCYGNMTPEMRGISHSKEEFKLARKVSMNQNVRELNDEISRMWLLDNPSHLTPFPVIDTSGMPR